jgi:hypothetical protein
MNTKKKEREMKRKKTSILSEKKRLKLSKKYIEGGGESKYARKRAYCLKHTDALHRLLLVGAMQGEVKKWIFLLRV